MVSFVNQTVKAFTPLNALLGNLGKITSDAAKVQIAALQTQAAEAKAAAQIEVAARQQMADADANQTKLAVQQSKERIALLKDEASATKSAAGSGGGGGGFSSRIPSFLQFSLLPIQTLATTAGAPGVATGAQTAASLIALTDSLTLVRAQVALLAERLSGMGGIIGAVATAGAGLAGSLGAVLAVLLPLAAVFVGLALVVKHFTDEAQASADRLKKAQEQGTAFGNAQVQVNQAIAGGATSEDIQAQLNAAREKLRLDRLSYIQNQELQDSVRAAGGDTSALAAEAEVLSEAINKDKTSVDAWSAAVGNNTVLNNDVIASYNELAKAAGDEAEFRRRLVGENRQQLEQQVTDAQAQRSQLQSLIELSSGKQKEAYQSQLTALDGIYDASGKVKIVAGQLDDLLSALAGARAAEIQEFGAKLRDLFSTSSLSAARTAQDRVISDTNQMFDHIEQMARAAEDFARQRAQEIADFNKSQQRAQEDYDEARAKSIEKFQEDEEQQAQDHQDRIAKIMRDSRLKILEAAANLDARAVWQEQQRRNQAVKDENDQYEQDKEQRRKAFEEQLQDQQDQFNKQKQRALDDFNERLQREDQQRALQLQRQQQDWELQNYRQQQQYALQDARRLEDMNHQIQQLVAHYGAMNLLQDFYQTYIEGKWAQFLSNLAGALFSSAASVPAVPGGGWGASAAALLTPGSSRYGSSSAVSISGNQIVLGDIGSYSRDEVAQMVEAGFRQLAARGIARVRGS